MSGHVVKAKHLYFWFAFAFRFFGSIDTGSLVRFAAFEEVDFRLRADKLIRASLGG